MKSFGSDGDSARTLTKVFLIAAFLLPFACRKKPLDENLQKSFTKECQADARAPDGDEKKKSKRKKLYLTFDDGPSKGTKNVLAIVKDEQIPVSFFIIGQNVFASASQEILWHSLKMTKKIELCNHSFCHAKGQYQKYYESPCLVVSDFERAKNTLELDNSIARTPGRNIWRIDSLQVTDRKKGAAAADSLQKAGFVLMGWDLEWQFDHKTMNVTRTAEQMIAAIDSAFESNRTRCKNNLVLLAHDQAYARSSDSMELRTFLQLLKQRDDYEFLIVSNYPGANEQVPTQLK
jgi:hypothetical protein